MSAYVCDSETISALAKAFVDYNVDFKAEGFTMPSLGGILFNVNDMRQSIGQHLLKVNVDAVNYRYGEERPVPDFKFVDVEINEGIVLGCIKCYAYQACELKEWDDMLVCHSLHALKEELLERLIEKAGYSVPWGYNGHDTFAPRF